MTEEGLKAVKALSKENIKTNVTLIFTPAQALLAARAGAYYVSPFLGRLDDIAINSLELIKTIVDIFKIQDITTEIIAASIRSPLQVVNAARVGAHIATVPANVIKAMLKHPLTDSGIEGFMKDWNDAFNK